MKSLTFDLRGEPGLVHAVDFGGSGQPIILVHGIGGNHTNWYSVGPELSKHGRVVAVDLVGCGYTEPLGRQCRLSTNEPIVRKLAQELGAPVVLVGHSMGGLLSLLLASHDPSLVESLVLIDPSQPGESPPPNPTFLAQLLLPSVPWVGKPALDRLVGAKTAEQRVQQAWAVSMVDQTRVSPTARKAAVKMAEHWFATPWHRASVLAAIVSTGRALVDPRRYRRAVATVQCPTMVIHGSQDHMISRSRIEKLAVSRPDWQVNFIAEAGHNPHLEAADQVVALIDAFLQN